ncbi:uridine phosphorylase [bacterium]|nr:uridine phosphorylase [candidate division CSSED10-310 bacterium]
MNSGDERQYHIHLKQGDVGRYVLLPGDPGRVEKIAGFLDDARPVAANREFVTWRGTHAGVPVAVVSTGIGCPSAAICLEELIKVGADTFIRVGTSGSLQPRVKLGDLVISTAAVREEGTSRQYVPLSFPAVADLDVTLALRDAAAALGFTAHAGITHCKDAFYIEGGVDLPLQESNQALWRTWLRAGVVSTAMEAGALFVLGSIRGVRVGEVMAVIGETWNDAPVVAKVGIDEAIRCALEAIRRLDGVAAPVDIF